MSDSVRPYVEWLGIPPGNGEPNHYELLGLPLYESNAERIRTQYWERYELVRRYEVGVFSDVALNLLDELSQAFKCLSDPESKREYDLRVFMSEHYDEPTVKCERACKKSCVNLPNGE